MVQHATTLGADRKCLSGRVRDELLSVAGRLARDGETQLKQSPENRGGSARRYTIFFFTGLSPRPPSAGSSNGSCASRQRAASNAQAETRSGLIGGIRVESRRVPLRRTRPEVVDRAASSVPRDVRLSHNDHLMGGVDNACAQDEVGADVPNRALDGGGIHARKRTGGLSKELLHLSREYNAV